MSPIYVPGKVTLAKPSGASWIITGTQKLDPDAAVYIDRVEAADGQSLEEGVKLAYSTFVSGCKTDGIWDAIKASCILAGARTLNGALVPLVGTAPTNYNFVAGDYDRETGLLGNASTKYLSSKRNNNADPQDNRHLAVYRTEPEVRGSTSAFIGFGGSSSGDSQLLYTSTNRYYRIAFGSDAIQADSTAVPGFIGVSRNSATSVDGRYASVTTQYGSNSATPTNGNILVFGRGVEGSPGAITDARIAFYSIGESLDLAMLDTRVTTLMSDLAAAIP